MFQNLADNKVELGKKDVKLDNKKIDFSRFKDIFMFQHIVIYILSFLVSLVSIKDGISPFAFAFFVAACSSAIPAGPILITTSVATFIMQGANGFLVYFLNPLLNSFSLFRKCLNY